MKTELIEKRIRSLYLAESGEWLVEKGKVAEAKLLKEACETIEKLRAENDRLWGASLRENAAAYNREQALNKREKELESREQRFRERVASLLSNLECWKE